MNSAAKSNRQIISFEELASPRKGWWGGILLKPSSPRCLHHLSLSKAEGLVMSGDSVATRSAPAGPAGPPWMSGTDRAGAGWSRAGGVMGPTHPKRR